MQVEEDQLLLRQALYRLYAGLLLYPEAERLETLKRGAQAVDEDLRKEAGSLPDEARLVLEWAAGINGELVQLQAQWVRLFGSSRDAYCFPHEGAYLGGSASGPLMAQLQREYARGGLGITANDLPDHISVELEYMSYLCGLELETLRAGEDDRRQRIVNAQHAFLREHLTQWLPALTKRVEECDDSKSFALVCRAAQQMTQADLEAVAARAER